MKKLIILIFISAIIFGFAKVNAFTEDTSSDPKPDGQATVSAKAASHAVKLSSEKLKIDLQKYRDAEKAGDKNAMEKALAAINIDKEQLKKDLKVMMKTRKSINKEQIEKLKARKAELQEKIKARQAEEQKKKNAEPTVK